MVTRATELPEATGVEVEAKMQEIQQRISGTVDNQRALERYEEVKSSTQQLEKEVAAMEVRLEQEELQVQQRAESWLLGIDTIAEKLNVKFSVYMSALNYGGATCCVEVAYCGIASPRCGSCCCCSDAGAVVLNKVGTFNTYELQIMVSYRKDRLAPLSGTSHRCVGIVIPKAA